jgi:hypothetical protein
MGGAVAATGSVAVQLLAQHIPVPVGEKRTEGMFAGIASPACDVECLAEQALVIGALGHPHSLQG